VPAAIAVEQAVVECRTQPVIPPAITPNSTIMPSIIRIRRRLGTTKNNVNANAEPPAGIHGKSRWTWLLVVQLGPCGAVVEMVRVVVAALVPVIEAGVVFPKLSVGI
jgi:hypothetical protein